MEKPTNLSKKQLKTFRKVLEEDNEEKILDFLDSINIKVQDFKDEFGNNLFQIACEDNLKNLSQKWAEVEWDLNSKNFKGENSFHTALHHNHPFWKNTVDQRGWPEPPNSNHLSELILGQPEEALALEALDRGWDPINYVEDWTLNRFPHIAARLNWPQFTQKTIEKYEEQFPWSEENQWQNNSICEASHYSSKSPEVLKALIQNLPNHLAPLLVEKNYRYSSPLVECLFNESYESTQLVHEAIQKYLPHKEVLYEGFSLHKPQKANLKTSMVPWTPWGIALSRENPQIRQWALEKFNPEKMWDSGNHWRWQKSLATYIHQTEELTTLEKKHPTADFGAVWHDEPSAKNNGSHTSNSGLQTAIRQSSMEATEWWLGRTKEMTEDPVVLSAKAHQDALKKTIHFSKLYPLPPSFFTKTSDMASLSKEEIEIIKTAENTPVQIKKRLEAYALLVPEEYFEQVHEIKNLDEVYWSKLWMIALYKGTNSRWSFINKATPPDKREKVLEILKSEIPNNLVKHSPDKANALQEKHLAPMLMSLSAPKIEFFKEIGVWEMMIKEFHSSNPKWNNENTASGYVSFEGAFCETWVHHMTTHPALALKLWEEIENQSHPKYTPTYTKDSHDPDPFESHTWNTPTHQTDSNTRRSDLSDYIKRSLFRLNSSKASWAFAASVIASADHRNRPWKPSQEQGWSEWASALRHDLLEKARSLGWFEETHPVYKSGWTQGSIKEIAPSLWKIAAEHQLYP